jgi:hypothetical protein
MNTKIALLLGNVAAPALQTSRAKDPTHNRPFKVYRDARPQRTRARPTLVMAWRTHPTSGRLECRWSLERSAPADEGVSRTDFFRLAA